MTTYVVKGEILNVIFGTFTESIDNTVSLQHPNGNWMSGDWIDKHSINTVINLLKYDYWKDFA